MKSDKRLLPLSTLPEVSARRLRLLASDIDDTLTVNGVFPQTLISTLAQLAKSGLQVLLVTGRHAGTAKTLASYLPHIAGVIAENGAVFVAAGNGPIEFLCDTASVPDFRERLNRAYEEIDAAFHVLPTGEDALRLTERTYIREDRFTLSDFKEMERIAESHGLGFMYSTVHAHLMLPGVNKADAVTRIAKEKLGIANPRLQVMTVGDSPNDRSLFRAEHFMYSAGVRNVADFVEALGPDLPRYLLNQREGRGFAELARFLVEARKD